MTFKVGDQVITIESHDGLPAGSKGKVYGTRGDPILLAPGIILPDNSLWCHGSWYVPKCKLRPVGYEDGVDPRIIEYLNTELGQ